MPTTDETVRRMDVRETHASLRGMARQPALAAFRYQRRPGEPRRLALDVKRFADAPVLSAIAERGSATTLVTSEGRMLTEMTFVVRNRAQPFMKINLPAGASILSSEVAGETTRPVTGADGTRVPLMRSNMRATGPYTVSFVYLHGGQALLKKGDAQMALATVDIPIGILEWELFLPEQYSAKPIGGNVIPIRSERPSDIVPVAAPAPPPPPAAGPVSALPVEKGNPAEIIGRVLDPTGATIPGATVTLSVGAGKLNEVLTDGDGTYRLSGVPSGTVTITGSLIGFKSSQSSFRYDGTPRRLDITLNVEALEETVMVMSEDARSRPNETRAEEVVQQAPSQNIVNMQRKVAGVLPVRVDVPRAGTSYRFVRPLVLNEETSVSFRYKRR
jgi:hypothetical protein